MARYEHVGPPTRLRKIPGGTIDVDKAHEATKKAWAIIRDFTEQHRKNTEIPMDTLKQRVD